MPTARALLNKDRQLSEGHQRQDGSCRHYSSRYPG